MLCGMPFGAAESLLLLNPTELHYFHGEEMFPLRKVAGSLQDTMSTTFLGDNPPQVHKKELYLNLKDGLLI